MSIVNDLIELNGDKSDIQDALVSKGVTSAGKHGFNKFASDIASITNQYTSSDEGKVVSDGSLVAQTSTTATTNGTIDTTTNNEVVVNVPNSYTQSDEGKVVSNGALVAQTAYPTTITENGTYSTTENNSVTVNVQSAASAYELIPPSSNSGILMNSELYSINSNSLTSVFGYFVYKTYGFTQSSATLSFEFDPAFTPSFTSEKLNSSSSSLTKGGTIDNGVYKIILSGLKPSSMYSIYIQSLFA